ncbi:hypothetical protein DACRYDRAFT_117257 [Dacryopinax primogenitus]|uniref:Uncharacterized protein n=1 Tax=Dacryopinax primogenitus (strain DJM 731) TaxID=1858805 RepID=M5FS76_DACPD|nr:uncharacterized protein DACRYDRAFT_117257 [Dacryopinax primogenitus]EJU00191.1 hypothetical protein DACRYDRAFT_117257 [Dacryopinax primogenitus]
MHLRPSSHLYSDPSTPSSQTSSSPSTALTTPSPAALSRVLVPSGLGDVRVPVERIDPVLATRMVMVTLESVLYVKSQVPMSVQQMNFLGEAGKNARAVKKRVELLQTLDVLSSHMTTTFIQLSTALARCSTHLTQGETGRTHVLITLGPPSGGSKERVLLELEGVEIRDWEQKEPESEDEEQTNEEMEDEIEVGGGCSDLEASSGEEELDDEQPEEPEEREVSPSPAHNRAARSLSSSTSSRELSVSPLNSPCPKRSQPVSAGRSQQRPPDPARMLALALINLNQTNTPPTRVHLLLRAPRRFEHPSWEPRQALSRALDRGCFGTSGMFKVKKAQPERVKVITTRPPTTPPPVPIPTLSALNQETEAEADEPLWFEWTDKLHGFMEI